MSSLAVLPISASGPNGLQQAAYPGANGLRTMQPWLPSLDAPPQIPYYKPVLTTPQTVSPLTQPGAITLPGRYLAQSVPLTPFNPLPRPEDLAPCLFSPHVGQGNTMPGTTAGPTNFYNYNTPGMTPGYGAPPPVYPNPGASNLPTAAPTPPKAEEKPKPEASKPAEPFAPLKDKLILTPALATEMNNDLQNPSVEVRIMAASRLGRVISGDPQLLSRPETKEVTEALLLKVLQDPSPVVRQPVMISLQAASDPTLSSGQPLAELPDSVMGLLNRLETNNSFFNFESADVSRLKSLLKTNHATAEQQAAMQAQAPAAAPFAGDHGMLAGPTGEASMAAPLPGTQPLPTGLAPIPPAASPMGLPADMAGAMAQNPALANLGLPPGQGMLPGQPEPQPFPVAPVTPAPMAPKPGGQMLFPSTQGMVPYYNPQPMGPQQAQRLNLVSQ